MSEILAGIFGSLITLLIIVLAIAAVVYIPRVRAHVFRILVKLFATHLGAEGAEALRTTMGLGVVEVNMGELLEEQNKIITGEISRVGSVSGQLRHRKVPPAPQ